MQRFQPAKKRQKDVEENNHCNALAIVRTTKVRAMLSNGTSCSGYRSHVLLFAATQLICYKQLGLRRLVRCHR
jgi:hypothetical protein